MHLTTGDVVMDFGLSESLRRQIELSLTGLSLRTRDVLADLGEEIGTLSSASTIIFGARDRFGAPSTSLIERLRAIAPHVGVFVVADTTADVQSWLLRHAHAGTDEVFCFDSEGDRLALATRLRLLVSAPAPEIALRALWLYWQSLSVRIEAMYCVRNGYRFADAFSPHRWFGLSEKTLRTKFHSAGLPTPWTLGRFGRQLRVKELILSGPHSMSELATLFGFETALQLGVDRRRVKVALKRWPQIAVLLGDT